MHRPKNIVTNIIKIEDGRYICYGKCIMSGSTVSCIRDKEEDALQATYHKLQQIRDSAACLYDDDIAEMKGLGD